MVVREKRVFTLRKWNLAGNTVAHCCKAKWLQFDFHFFYKIDGAIIVGIAARVRNSNDRNDWVSLLSAECVMRVGRRDVWRIECNINFEFDSNIGIFVFRLIKRNSWNYFNSFRFDDRYYEKYNIVWRSQIRDGTNGKRLFEKWKCHSLSNFLNATIVSWLEGGEVSYRNARNVLRQSYLRYDAIFASYTCCSRHDYCARLAGTYVSVENLILIVERAVMNLVSNICVNGTSRDLQFQRERAPQRVVNKATKRIV